MSVGYREANACLQYHDLKTLPEQVLLGMRWVYEEERAGSIWLAVDVAIPAVIGRFQIMLLKAEPFELWDSSWIHRSPVHDGNNRVRMQPMKPHTLAVSQCTYTSTPIQSNDGHTRVHRFIVDSVWAFGYRQMESALSMHGWTAYRDVSDSRQPIAVQRSAPKNTIWRFCHAHGPCSSSRFPTQTPAGSWNTA